MEESSGEWFDVDAVAKLIQDMQTFELRDSLREVRAIPDVPEDAIPASLDRLREALGGSTGSAISIQRVELELWLLSVLATISADNGKYPDPLNEGVGRTALEYALTRREGEAVLEDFGVLKAALGV